ncbi:UNVERIFIED_CONTAM: hypothetical protein PYX00_005448 [Menopon gallinae]|uniref:Sorting nexin 29 n=1 Tax=Menopon gallinae TaxID=328185 RepID=A0AAW2HR83_9NEOP
MMAAVVTSSREDARSKERERVLAELLDAVKQCQIRFGGKSVLATETDQHVSTLCRCLENVFNHGLRSRPLCKNSSTLEQVTDIVTNTFRYSQEPPCFWHYVRKYLTKHELDRYMSLKKINTDVGRGRAWLRSSLNERSLDKYLHSLLANCADASVYYHDWALLLDQDLNSTLPNIARGLSPILFAIRINDDSFNESSVTMETYQLTKSEPVLAVPIEDGQKHRRRRKAPAHIVSFDEKGESPPDSAAPFCVSSSAQSASFLCSPLSVDQKLFNYVEESKKMDQNSASPSSNDSSFHDFDSTARPETSTASAAPVETMQVLTPVSDNNVGELILISGEEMPQDIIEVGECDESLFETVPNIKLEGSVTEENVRMLLNMIEQLKEANLGLKTKMVSLKVQQKEENSKLQNQLQALTRENEVLKHQLRKYVDAVQMLNKDGAAHEALACLEASKEAIQEREEALQYQQKLVQVAEMHGELMEFNDKLHKLIQSKDEIIKRLERELTDLRGPLPSSSLWDEDVVVPEALINICIPSAFLTGGSTDVHHVYQVYVRIRDTEWNIYRRYTQFYSLHKELKKEYALVAALDFPPKKTIGNKDSKFVEDRRLRLQRYLRQLVDVLSKTRSDLTDPAGLVSVIPFFGQNCGKPEGKQKSSQRGQFGRRSKPVTAIDPVQYNGL